MPGRLTPRIAGCIALVLFGAAVRPPVPAAAPGPERIEFNRDIRPILSDLCFHCHGPDAAKRKAKLRLDTEEGARADHDGVRALVPGDPGKSELLRRMITEDEKDRMPPTKLGRRLSPQQIALVKRWIEQGGQWQKHWSLIPSSRPELPHVTDKTWPRTGIDRFILARLEREGLKPAAEAERATLIRRVSLDLTGLPPTPAEVDAFVRDTSPDAYEKVVDRLLTSPRFGERMAVRWLDAARYADTNGYQSDGERFMWRWRDWVIDALNRNLAFDQFAIEQLAGDMLPGATLEQKIATGFNRNHRGNAEGGIVPEEYAVEYVADRVETTATVWLGMTMTCARCHDHKFDPLTQKDFYRLFAYFNNVPERGKAIKYGNSPPLMRAPTPEQARELRELAAKRDEAANAFRARLQELAAAQAAWEKSPSLPGGRIGWSIHDGLAAHIPLDGKLTTGTLRQGEPIFDAGRFGKALDLDGKRFLDAGDIGKFGFYSKFSLTAWVYPRDVRHVTIISRMTDVDQAAGYQLRFHEGKVQANLVVRWLDDALRVETQRALEPNRWHHVTMTYDGTRLASGVKIYVDGVDEKLKVNLDDLNQTFESKEPLRIGAGGGAAGHFNGLLHDVRVYNRSLRPEEAAIVAVPEGIEALLALAPERRIPAQAAKLRAYFLEKHAPEPIREAHRRAARLRDEYDALEEHIPTTMVMQEMPKPRQTYLLLRGVYDKPGEKVSPGVPETMPALAKALPNNRMGFARWLVDRENPLTARVAVNRYWQMYFGVGLVKTVEDFGSQGEWPSHPELLDWLATEFVRSGWDVKAMQRLIVTSAAYRQSSRVTPALLQRDPENRLLTRGPRFRLPAETIRDQALFASGLLVERLGGPSVKPYQPDGLWKELADSDYVADVGPSLYRRSMYTFWKRTVAPPSMITFDAAGRETCIVRETRTNTPLQALNLMNDVTYVEAGRALAQRVLREGGPTPEERVTLAFRLVLSRSPRPVEKKVLLAGLAEHLQTYRADRAAAQKLIRAGASKPDKKLDVAELAAYTAVASLILNLDEAVTKE
jgi:hypothetical protein